MGLAGRAGVAVAWAHDPDARGPATADRFDDVAAVVAPGGNPRGCWCLAYRLTSPDFDALDDDRRPEVLRDLCGREPAPGVLAYAGDVPVGWCGVGPRADMARLQRSRTIPAHDDVPVWSIVCLVVGSGHRGQGVTRALVDGAVAHARRHGAPAVEAYPVDPGGARVNPTLAYVGTTRMFERAGFRRVALTGARSGGLPRWRVRLDLGEEVG